MSLTDDLSSLILLAARGEDGKVTAKSVARLGTEMGRARDANPTLALFCDFFVKGYRNFNYNFNTNGERMVLSRLAALEPRIVFDVGANEGQWALAAASALPDARIHAFEIIPDTFRILTEKTAGEVRITANDFGLFDRDGALEMNAFAGSNQVATFTDYPHGAAERVAGRVRTGDGYMQENGIRRIDFLKIDVEGAEAHVLRGFSEALAQGRIDVIQFEYGKASILTHFLLYDFCKLLGEHGYTVGKIYPEFVDFRPYSLNDEDFLGPNYLACLSRRTDILGLFARP